MPAIILVVHIDPGPMPTFKESTPADIKAFAASAVAIFPTTISVFLFLFNFLLIL
ncbi:MAG: hypothetical protein Ct9H90mP22_1870 [Gammaproteobacteria bacterium]|nr:MAG: hypothetical protein Ct9H90mP22_1870 [Gammaproteobacteria bacterium]